MKLPQLPNPERIDAVQFCDDAYWFSAEQMIEYARLSISYSNAFDGNVLHADDKSGKTMDKKAVFDAISSERDYQDKKWGTPAEHPHDVGGYLTLMAVHLRRAQEAWACSNNDIEALTALRKVLAVGVACGEQHGIHMRVDVIK